MEQLKFLKLQVDRYKTDYIKRLCAEFIKGFKEIRKNKRLHAKIYKRLKRHYASM